MSMVMTRVNRGFVKLATMIGRAAETVIPDTSQSCEMQFTWPSRTGEIQERVKFRWNDCDCRRGTLLR